jgi:predicted kinase
MLIIIFGEIGAGKSTLAKALASKFDFYLIQFDPLVLPVTGKKKMYEDDGAFLLTDEDMERVHEGMRNNAMEFLQSGKKVIVESMYFKKQREAMIALAKKMNIQFHLIKVACDEKEIYFRIKERLKVNSQAAGTDLFRENKGKLDDEERDHLILDTTGKSVEECVQEASKAIGL